MSSRQCVQRSTCRSTRSQSRGVGGGPQKSRGSSRRPDRSLTHPHDLPAHRPSSRAPTAPDDTLARGAANASRRPMADQSLYELFATGLAESIRSGSQYPGCRISRHGRAQSRKSCGVGIEKPRCVAWPHPSTAALPSPTSREFRLGRTSALPSVPCTATTCIGLCHRARRRRRDRRAASTLRRATAGCSAKRDPKAIVEDVLQTLWCDLVTDSAGARSITKYSAAVSCRLGCGCWWCAWR